METNNPIKEPYFKPLAPNAPTWLRDISQFFAIRAQFILTGNTRDYVLVPTIDDFSPLLLKDTIATLLETFGYEFLLCYDPFDRFSLHNPSSQRIAITNKATGLSLDENGYADQSCKKLREVMKLLVNSERHGALIIEHATRFGEEDYNELLGQALKLSQTAQQRPMQDGKIRFNPIFWVVENETTLPPWFIHQNERIRIQNIPAPDYDARLSAISVLSKGIQGFNSISDPERDQIIRDFARATDGLTIHALVSIALLTRDNCVSFSKILDIVKLYKMGITESPWDQIGLAKEIRKAKSILEDRVIGQKQAILKTIDTLIRSVTGLSGAWRTSDSIGSDEPRGVLFFAGPTGVGKTELAKAITSLLFGNESAYIRFDMSEFAQEHTEARLIGAPPGYTGHDAGGELTKAIRAKPFSVVLFDEIEKAHPRILDKFLQILQDGRLTDGRGETVYFSESIIIFTSNLGIYKELPNGERTPNVEPSMVYDEIKTKVISEIEIFFKYKLVRPEILNRIGDNIVVFNFISANVAAKLFNRQLDNIKKRLLKKRNLTLEISETIVEQLLAICTKDLSNGGRGIGNRLETVFLNPLSRALFDLEVAPESRVKITGLSLEDGVYSVALSC